MPPYANLGVILLSLLGAFCAPFVSCQDDYKECLEQNGIQTIQKTCGQHSDSLHQADTKHLDRDVCRHLFEGLMCVATHVPDCFNFYYQAMSHYIHSPYSCNVTNGQIRQLQKAINSHLEPENDKEPTTATPTSPPPPAPAPYPIPSANVKTVHHDKVDMASNHDQEGGASDEVGGLDEIWPYLDLDNNVTSLFEETGTFNVTGESGGHSDKGAGSSVTNTGIWVVFSLASVAVTLSGNVIS